MDILKYVFNPSDWIIFFKQFFILIGIVIAACFLWLFPFSLIVAPLYSSTYKVPKEPIVVYDTHGQTTAMAIQSGLKTIQKRGLVTNFVGVNMYIDNNYFEQIGQIEIFRLALFSLENNLGRNRGTGGANEHLVQARSDIYSDFKTPFFTSFNTRISQTNNEIDLYVKDLISGKAVFIANSDNLAETLDNLKMQIQTNLAHEKATMFTEDDYFYRIRGNLIATYIFLKGIEVDFKSKLSDKTAFKENFEPILIDLERAINNNPMIVLESFGDLSKLEKDANIITQKLAELRDRLIKG